MSAESEGKSEVAALPATQTTDELYEFLAPKFFDFIKGETEDDVREAELWFEFDKSYAPSPFVPKIKARQSSQKVKIQCDFDDSEQMTETEKSSEEIDVKGQDETVSNEEITEKGAKTQEVDEAVPASEKAAIRTALPEIKSEVCCTPNASTGSKNEDGKFATKNTKNDDEPDAKREIQLQKSKVKPSSSKRGPAINNSVVINHFAQENQAIKRQKLDGGKTRQILCLKPPQPLPHKSKLGTANAASNSMNPKLSKGERKMYVREQQAPVPFVSMAEMVKKFQSNTREMPIPTSCSKPNLTLTRPKEPEFETSQRIRTVKVKSSAELEEEMIAKMPKFKARPVNKKILEAPTVLAPPRTAPKPFEFHEFHFETSARAGHHCDVVSVHPPDESAHHTNKPWKPHLTEPKTPLLQTSMRSRPALAKTTEELEKEELEKIPKFKARPLNKKIFESKGEIGVYCNTKKQITIPQEFHFATNDRIPPPTAVSEMFDKLSLCSEVSSKCPPLPRKTTPNPFHLLTEERGLFKEKRFVEQVIHKQVEEEAARIPKANPYPYTTDYPVIPPKPEPKEPTKPEPFQLESVVRHEAEVQKELEEKQRREQEEVQLRIFKAQPILKEDPIPLPDKVRKPLTQIQQFNLHVDQRAPEREEFDLKIKEKEKQYKRYREETEAAKMIEEEKALKQLRKTMIHHAIPVPSFDHPFLPQKSMKPTTKSKSPNLQVRRRKEIRKTIVSSSPAVNMR